MIDIKLDGGYRIYNRDELNVVLAKTYTVENPKSKNVGQEKEKILGYYEGLKQALRGYATRRANDGQTQICGDVAQIVAALENIEETIAKACKA